MNDDRTQSHQHPIDPERVARAQERLPSREDAAALASILTLISDPTRSRVLYALDVAEELCVGDLALALEVNEDAVGYALRVLRTAGLVTNRREGRVVYYRLAVDFPEPLLDSCLWRLVDLSRSPGTDDAS
ncbi:transcriptional regulator [Geodermatophilus sp. DF01-2]|uniref:ArsR/SmtB family transcription factor n=1 Tax=Geodermatophilus sp. DF01-2 TaxID=2559610 RepID=UPI0010744CEE|nr:metalloregulator ArsR/SmtB family transcription factor [Geodermatophilus sp. DF01_2]TFV64496.1 transcriptional regulator [Geodermatophilus sp. DF01_2]